MLVVHRQQSVPYPVGQVLGVTHIVSSTFLFHENHGENVVR